MEGIVPFFAVPYFHVSASVGKEPSNIPNESLIPQKEGTLYGKLKTGVLNLF